MDWLEFVKQAGDGPVKVGLLTALYFGVRQLSQMRKTMEKLNTSIAVIVEKVSSHEKRITTLERKRK